MNLDWYKRAWERHGNTPQGMGYNGEDQINQYRVAKSLGASGRVVDLGGGFCVGREVFPDLIVIDVHREPLSAPAVCGDHHCIKGADYILMLGIFSIGYRWEEVEEVVRRVFEVVADGVVITFTKVSDRRVKAFPLLFWNDLLYSLDPKLTVCTGWDPYLTAVRATK
jgi:hypothetical protein